MKPASTSPKKGIKVEIPIVVKGKWQEEVEELMSTPGKKRSRTTVKIEVKVETKGEVDDYPTPVKTPKKRKIQVKIEEDTPSKNF